MYWCVFLLFILLSVRLFCFFSRVDFSRHGTGCGVGDLVSSGQGSWSAPSWPEGHLVDVLREPAEALAITLSLQHAAHEHLQWSRVQVLQWDVALETRPPALAKVSISLVCSWMQSTPFEMYSTYQRFCSRVMMESSIITGVYTRPPPPLLCD